METVRAATAKAPPRTPRTAPPATRKPFTRAAAAAAAATPGTGRPGRKTPLTRVARHATVPAARRPIPTLPNSPASSGGSQDGGSQVGGSQGGEDARERGLDGSEGGEEEASGAGRQSCGAQTSPKEIASQLGGDSSGGGGGGGGDSRNSPQNNPQNSPQTSPPPSLKVRRQQRQQTVDEGGSVPHCAATGHHVPTLVGAQELAPPPSRAPAASIPFTRALSWLGERRRGRRRPATPTRHTSLDRGRGLGRQQRRRGGGTGRRRRRHGGDEGGGGGGGSSSSSSKSGSEAGARDDGNVGDGGVSVPRPWDLNTPLSRGGASCLEPERRRSSTRAGGGGGAEASEEEKERLEEAYRTRATVAMPLSVAEESVEVSSEGMGSHTGEGRPRGRGEQDGDEGGRRPSSLSPSEASNGDEEGVRSTSAATWTKVATRSGAFLWCPPTAVALMPVVALGALQETVARRRILDSPCLGTVAPTLFTVVRLDKV
eukprot:g8494.t1